MPHILQLFTKLSLQNIITKQSSGSIILQKSQELSKFIQETGFLETSTAGFQFER